MPYADPAIRKAYAKQYYKRWAVENKDKLAAATKRYRTKGGAKLKKREAVRALRWRELNAERYKATRLAWAARNRDKLAEASRENRKRNPEKAYALVARWVKKNPERVIIYAQRRRARKRAVEDTLTLEQWQNIKAFYGHICLGCKRTEEELNKLGLKLVPDHVVALSKLGGNCAANIQPLCHGKRGCNNLKYTRHIDYRKNVGK